MIWLVLGLWQVARMTKGDADGARMTTGAAYGTRMAKGAADGAWMAKGGLGRWLRWLAWSERPPGQPDQGRWPKRFEQIFFFDHHHVQNSVFTPSDHRRFRLSSPKKTRPGGQRCVLKHFWAYPLIEMGGGNLSTAIVTFSGRYARELL